MSILEFMKKDSATSQPVSEFKRAADDAAKLATECLKNEIFSKYKKNVETLVDDKFYAAIVHLEKTEADPLRYAFIMKGLVTEWRACRMLLGWVKQDSGAKG